jgi:NitT/TauT family transport system substrate-binding protein
MKSKIVLISSVVLFFFLTLEGWAQIKEIKMSVGPAGTIGNMPTYIAQGLGYFKDLEKEGLKVSFVYFPAGPPAALALMGGDVEFGNMVIIQAIKAKEQGKDLKFLVTFSNAQQTALISQISLKDINSPKDLKGKKIGVTSLGSASHMQACHVLKRYGIDPKDVVFIPVGSGEVVGPWKQKAIDALINLDPWITDFIENGSAKMLLDMRSVEKTAELYGSEVTTGGLLARADYVEKNPEVVQKVVNVYVRTLQWIATKSAAEVAKAAPKELSWKLSHIENNMAGLSRNGLVLKKGVETAFKTLKDDKLISPDFNVPVETFYDNRFVEKALKK